MAASPGIFSWGTPYVARPRAAADSDDGARGGSSTRVKVQEPRPLRVLFVEDSEPDSALLSRHLKSAGFAVESRRVETRGEMEAALDEASWDLVLCDFTLPQLDAIAALQLVRERKLDLPFIIVSGTVGEETAVKSMRAGAHDYFLKDKLGHRFAAVVERELHEASVRAAARVLEQRVQVTEARYGLLVEQAHDGIFVLTPAGVACDVNRRGEALLGSARSAVVGKPLGNWFARAARARVRAAFERLGAESSVVLDALELDRAVGAERLVELSLALAELPEETLVIGIMRDVTEQHRTNLALRVSEERFRTLVSSMDDIVFTLDSERRYTGIYGRWIAREGVRAEALLGKKAPEIFGPAAAAHEAATTRALAGTSVVYEWTLDAANGSRHFQISLSPVWGSSGQVTGIVGVGRETTEQKRMHAQLLESDRMVTMGTIAAGVAHEINNPLASIIANIDLARAKLAECGDEQVLEDLNDAKDASLRVRDIVRDLRILSRAEDDRRSPVDVRRVLESSLRIVWNELRHRARLVKDYGEIPLVEANESRLGQVFLNLIVNAAQAIPAGNAEGNEIQIKTGVDAQGRVFVDVKDSGTGMSPEVVRKLFTPFFTTKPMGVGTGLGLSICHRIVSSLGGEIQVESREGAGTRFRVVLPPTASQARAPSLPSPVVTPRAGGRILVVDDDPNIRSTLGRVLGEHEVVATSSAREALELVAGGASFDVILCDLMMPQLTGMQFYDQLQQIAPELARKTVFITAGAFTPPAREFLERQDCVWIEKPFDNWSLRNLISERIARTTRVTE